MAHADLHADQRATRVVVSPAEPPDRPFGIATIPPGPRPAADLLTVTVRPVPSGPVVVAAHGEVDWYTSLLLQDTLLAQVRPNGPRLVTDLTDVGFFGATGLTVLLTVARAAAAAEVRLCLVAHGRAVLLPLTITGLDRVFDIHPALAGALSCPRGGADE